MSTKQIKVSIAVGTRPEMVKLFPVISELQRRSKYFAPRVIITSQHREILRQMVELFGLTPDVDFGVMDHGQTPLSVLIKILSAMERELRDFRPDLVLVQGDTTTALSCALSAYYQGVSVGHVEAGIRSGNLRAPFPEEANRQIISRLADLHFAPTSRTRENLLSEGIDGGRIFVTGNTVVDSLRYALDKEVKLSSTAESILSGSRKFVLLTLHRREIHGAVLRSICEGILSAAKTETSYDFVIPVHPNPAVRETVCGSLSGTPNILLIEPQDYFSFVKLMSAATLIVTDSGGIQEEAPYLGKYVLVVRNETDRPESIDSGVAQLVGTDGPAIAAKITTALKDSLTLPRETSQEVFGDGGSAETIVDILEQHFR